MHKGSPLLILGLYLCLSGVSLSLGASEKTTPRAEPKTTTELPTLKPSVKDKAKQEKPSKSYTPIQPWPELDLGLCDN